MFRSSRDNKKIFDNFNMNLSKNEGFLTYILCIQSNALQITWVLLTMRRSRFERGSSITFFPGFFQMVGKESFFSLLTEPSTWIDLSKESGKKWSEQTAKRPSGLKCARCVPTKAFHFARRVLLIGDLWTRLFGFCWVDDVTSVLVPVLLLRAELCSSNNGGRFDREYAGIIIILLVVISPWDSANLLLRVSTFKIWGEKRRCIFDRSRN